MRGVAACRSADDGHGNGAGAHRDCARRSAGEYRPADDSHDRNTERRSGHAGSGAQLRRDGCDGAEKAGEEGGAQDAGHERPTRQFFNPLNFFAWGARQSY